MKKAIVAFLFTSLIFLVGCATSVTSYKDSTDATDATDETEGYLSTTMAAIAGEDGTATTDVVDTTQATSVIPGQLTASEWSDLENYDFYKSLFESSQDSPNGIFTEYFDLGYVDTLNLIKVHVHNADDSIYGAEVVLFDDNQDVIHTALTDVFGNAYLFPGTDQLSSVSSIEVTYGELFVQENYTYSVENNLLDYDTVLTNTHEDTIEIMFVIDTTGSMGDEIVYLKAEVDNVISEVSDLNPNATIKLALLFYRDQGDIYVTKYFDFSTNIDSQRALLNEQMATGGGDFPEAVATALDEAVNKNWSDSNSTKLIIHVCDAPPHQDETSIALFSNALTTASQLGIRIIPVASSGIDKFTEYLLRNEAMLTGGTYVFLTNDSGIGGDHIEATVGDVEVEYLNQLLIRLIVEYHTGIEMGVIPVYSDSGQ